jgi:hypothetical protein
VFNLGSIHENTKLKKRREDKGMGEREFQVIRIIVQDGKGVQLIDKEVGDSLVRVCHPVVWFVRRVRHIVQNTCVN